MKCLKKQGELTPNVGDHLVAVGGHQAAGVHDHAVELRRVAGSCQPLGRNALAGSQEPPAAASSRHHKEIRDGSELPDGPRETSAEA
jgi:hypothetical protein